MARPSRRRKQSPSGRPDRTADAYEQLRELIVRGRLAPGTRVIESEVAEHMGVSRTPARGALQRLQLEGYVLAAEGARQARLLVAPLSEADAGELFEIVGGIEGLAAKHSADLPAGERAALVRELNDLNGQLEAAAQEEVPSKNEIFRLDAAFHRHYVDAGAGPRLIALHDAIKPQAERYIRLYVSVLLNEIGSSVVEHAATIHCIARGDAEGARAAVENNWRNAAERLSPVIAEVGDREDW